MIRSSRRSAGRSRAVVAALVAAGATVLAGCQAGQLAQTAEQIPTIDGASAQVGPLALRDVTIEYPESGSWPQGSDARLRLIVVNEGRDADRLVEVRTDAADRVTFERRRAVRARPAPERTSPPPPPTATPTPSASPSGSGSPDASGSPSATASGSATVDGRPTPTPTEEAETSITIPAAGLIELRERRPGDPADRADPGAAAGPGGAGHLRLRAGGRGDRPGGGRHSRIEEVSRRRPCPAEDEGEE